MIILQSKLINIQSLKIPHKHLQGFYALSEPFFTEVLQLQSCCQTVSNSLYSPYPLWHITKDHNRVNKMRDWTRKELAQTNEPSWLANLFLFTALPENMDTLEPAQLFLDPVWYLPSDDENPVSLLGE
jgi:hypothetical protein